MRLHTLWKMWDDDNVELLFALDEYTVENNLDAWWEGVNAACERYKIALADTREVIVTVPHEPIARAFLPVEVDGGVEPPGRGRSE